jgi:Uma2 family endonuclease
MVSMTTPDLWLSQDRVVTVEDLQNMSEDEFRYELDDGMLIVSPAPSPRHQLAATRLAVILTAACPDHLVVIGALGMNISKFQHRVPDVAVVPADSLDTYYEEQPPLLAVEIASPRTRLYDRNRKKDVYESFGILAYWIVEPDPDRPRLIAFELRNGKYQTVADVTGPDEFRATSPFAVTIRPDVLTRTGPLTG